ncbi:MAG: TrmH family RNA methyltransferase [Bacteroidales bacterium]
MVKRTLQSAKLFQNNNYPGEIYPPIIVGYQIKTPENIGNIIRLADNAGCREAIFITSLEKIRLSKIKKTASSSFDAVKWRFCKPDEFESVIPDDYQWVAIETSSDSKDIFKSKLPQKAALFVGNEISGINNQILDRCEQIVHVPLFGNNSSLNVSHALAIALFEWQRQSFY